MVPTPICVPTLLAAENGLDALPVPAIIIDNDADGKPLTCQKRLVRSGQRLGRWFCTTDADWPKSSARLLRDGTTYTTLWLPKAS